VCILNLVRKIYIWALQAPSGPGWVGLSSPVVHHGMDAVMLGKDGGHLGEPSTHERFGK
jgi:hypothetical protein